MNAAGTSPLFVAVLRRAGDQCEATASRGQRCPRTWPTVALQVAPRDPAVSETAGSRLAPEELAAWCPDHLVEARRRVSARRSRRTVPAGQLSMESLLTGNQPVTSGTTDSSGGRGER